MQLTYELLYLILWTPIIHAGISLVDETPEKQSSDQTNPPGSQGLAEGLEFAYTVPTQNTSKKDEVSRFVWLLFS